MYGEWTCAAVGPQCEEDCANVLTKFPQSAGREVVVAVVHHLSSTLGLTQPPEPSPLTTTKEVAWCMEVISYGMSLPLSEHDTIRDCVNVYCEWLSALLPTSKICVPRPICDDPNVHARKMISHFYNLFVPRKGEGADTINRQAVLCHRVLRMLQNAAQCSSIMDSETWERLLLFLLSINDTLLAPPAVKDGVGDQLCERVLSVLFELWLLACNRSFPTPPLWNSLYQMCTNWRHRPALVDQWNRVNFVLTSKLLPSLFGPAFPQLKIIDDDWQLVSTNIFQDSILQAWYRFLRCLGNPVDLCRPALISQTHKFLQFVLMNETVGDPCQHPCLAQLPVAFLRAMQGVATLVDSFLGIVHQHPLFIEESEKKEHSPSQTPSPPRRMAKSFSVAPSAVTKGVPRATLIGLTSRVSIPQSTSTPNSGPPSTSSVGSTSSMFISSESRTKLSPSRPKCNSILHLFGEWLFEAVHIGNEVASTSGIKSEAPSSSNLSVTSNTSSISLLSKSTTSSQSQLKRPGSLLVDGKQGTSIGVQASALMDSVEIPQWLAIAKYEAGRAQAMGALCRIFCSKRTGEEILPSYLARFYLAIHYGLQTQQPRTCSDLTASILLNSSDLLRLDLNGIHVLVPDVIQALDVVLPDRDVQIMSSNISKVELRRASIHLLLSMLALPLHFQNLGIKDISLRGSDKRQSVTFAQLKPTLVNLLINALQIETDSQNTHMLLGGLQMCVLDSASFEAVDQVTQVDALDSTSNLLCSDTAHALFVRATYLVCHRLISSWKGDLNVSLAALELLGGFAKTHIHEQDSLECKRAVKWLCDYIMYQCSRPPPAHSKDLHSSIVAAFQCAATWLVSHPYLLSDADTLATLLEVMELGISGTKSQGKPSDQLQKKHEKDLKPVSMRVRDAAEALLTVVLEQVGHSSQNSGVWQVGEHALLGHLHPGLQDDPGSSIEHFHYFALENSTVLALLEEPLGNDQDPQPTITSLIRGPFGCHGWTMQLKHLPRHKAGSKYSIRNPGRPVPMSDETSAADGRSTPRFFPENVDSIPLCNVDKCIPSLDAPSSHFLKQLVDQQENRRDEKYDGVSQSSLPLNLESECSAPHHNNEFETARLFLSHFGFLSPEALQETLCSPVPSLVTLDSSKPGFYTEMAELDNIGTRTSDTVHLFYVKNGQTTATEILNNVINQDNVDYQFLEFLNSLGWPADVHGRQNMTGKQPNTFHKTEQSTQGGNLYSEENKVLYWTDVSSEIAFVVPSTRSPTSSPHQGIKSEKHTLSLDMEHQKGKLPASSCDVKVFVFWLESFEDRLTLPLDDLLQETASGMADLVTSWESNCFVICIHALQVGLFRVHMQGPTARVSFATPLVDGMVVSHRVLGLLVRQTALNMCKRRRLESENYLPPHVRRKLKIQDIVQKYLDHVSQSDFYTRLFHGKNI